MLRLFRWAGYEVIVNTNGKYAVFMLGDGKVFVSSFHKPNCFTNCDGKFQFEFDQKYETLIVTGPVQVLNKLL